MTSESAAPPMSRRSWYLPTEVADGLSRAVDEIHWRTHRRKSEILAAALETALEHRAEIEARLSGGDQP
jgi:predicted transcriptional regulator